MMPLVLALVALALALFVFRPLALPWLNTLSRSHIWLLDALLFNTGQGMAERMLAISGGAKWASSLKIWIESIWRESIWVKVAFW